MTTDFQRLAAELREDQQRIAEAEARLLAEKKEYTDIPLTRYGIQNLTPKKIQSIRESKLQERKMIRKQVQDKARALGNRMSWDRK